MKGPKHFKTRTSHDGIEPLRGLEALDGLAGHGPHVGSSVALDLRHVAQTAHGEAIKFSPERLGDATPDTGFARARRAY